MKRFAWIVISAFALTLLLSAVGWAAPGYIVQADIVRSAEGTPMGPVCVPNSVFLPGEGVVVRAKVYDLATGQEVDGATIQEKGIRVQAILGDQSFEMAFFPHPPDPNAPAHDEYWTSLWVIPADFPAGVISWSVVVSDKSGQQSAFEPIGQDVGIPALMVLPGGGDPNA